MKKWMALALAVPLVCSVEMAEASITRDDLSLGGISQGMDMDYVKQIYGKPDSEKVEPIMGWSGWYRALKYGDTITVYCDGDTKTGPMQVTFVESKGNNGFETPRGLHVGSKAGEVVKAYGYPDIVVQGNIYVYYPDSNDKHFRLMFWVEKGIVTEIFAGMTFE